MKTVAETTIEELQTLIEDTIERKLRKLFEPAKDPRTLEEAFASIDKHMWTPPPGAKSSLELLREDRVR